jgi:hypothetical protein
MKRFYFLVLAALLAVSCKPCCEHVRNELRAPAYPLVTIDPFTCAWSAADRLYDAPVTHWTGVEHHLVGVVNVDGVDYRFLGQPAEERIFIANISEKKGWDAKYTMNRPSGKWMNPEYNDSKWTLGRGAFGSESKKPNIHTVWDGPEVWVRREFTMDNELPGQDVDMYLRQRHL